MVEENRISVWVCREEKLVLGLSKRTTCADVIQVLLEDQDSGMGLSLAPRSYCLVEKWRGFERVLPNKTKIWRLWLAWGTEQKNVKFVIMKSDASFSNQAARSAEARVVRSEQSPCVIKGSVQSPVGVCPEKQRRIVRKAFRKLEKIKKRRARRDASSAEKMETFVHVVLSQDHTIRQQVQRLAELDAEIELREAQVHRERVQRHGANYVQDTYLVSSDTGSVQTETLCAESLKQLECYVIQCEALVQLQEEVQKHEALVDSLTAQIQEELGQRWMQRKQQQLTPRTSPCDPNLEAKLTSENQLLLEEERIKTQLEASWYIGLRLDTDLEAVRSDLELCREIYGSRTQDMSVLLQKLNTLDLKGVANSDGGRDCMDSLDNKNEWVEQARGLSKAHSVNDEDSDTGLSSLHSQDSDPAQWEVVV